jgi:ankyrin repeat protein
MAPKELNNDEKAFLLYCKIGSINLVKNYIDDIRFDVDFIDKDENSPLHIAAINNKKEVFEELINAGAKTDIRNNKGERAIDIALLKCC